MPHVEENIRRYLDAAEQGDSDAQYRLARCYAGGNGIEKDEEKAKRWMQLAAEQGHVGARIALRWSVGGGEPLSPRLNWNAPLEWVSRFILSRNRWEFARTLAVLGGVVGGMTGMIQWLLGRECPPFGHWSFSLVILGIITTSLSGFLAGLVFYELIRQYSALQKESTS